MLSSPGPTGMMVSSFCTKTGKPGPDPLLVTACALMFAHFIRFVGREDLNGNAIKILDACLTHFFARLAVVLT